MYNVRSSSVSVRLRLNQLCLPFQAQQCTTGPAITDTYRVSERNANLYAVVANDLQSGHFLL